eukprot:TRINITY_DN1106_c0_g1_i1.p1 TRINITY_DN1106_c0_g1~~TRINITY_DN1106_c0_g1_i1.p1  ORF type:complete len:295 (-),score=91.32 TRINITY_DN1106_c0_g1_i1:112-969(-)
MIKKVNKQAGKSKPPKVEIKKEKKIKKDKEEKIPKEEKEELASEDFGMKDSDVEQLKAKTKKVEKKEQEKAKSEETGNITEESEEASPPAKKVKVMRKDSLIKSKTTKSKEKSFISLSNPEQDNKAPKIVKKFRRSTGVVYLSHIPHGFYEKQMREFFSQFGAVTNLRLGRSKRTGRSRGYAFIEFQFHEVAKIVAETMNNYLMNNRIMKCQLIPKEQCSRAIFMGKVKPSLPPGVAVRRLNKKVTNATKSNQTNMKRKANQRRKLKGISKKLEAQGIDYKIEIS